MTTTYKLIQLTNLDIGDVPSGGFMPLGRVTRRINAPYNSCSTFVVTSTLADSVILNDPGFYKITYSLTGAPSAVGTVTTGIVVNGTTVYSVSEYAADITGPLNITVPYVIRVSPNCAGAPDNVPVTVQILNSGVALTGTSGNLIIEKI
jgi:hypothetical protein